MSEFQEIAHSGGKLTLLFKEPSSIALEYQQCGPGGMALMQIGVSLDGKEIEYWPCGGVDMRDPIPPSPMVATFLISDCKRFFGRQCPKCSSYFRTDRPGKDIRCPYCAHRNWNAAFTTPNQLQFINKIREGYLEVMKEKRSITIDLDKLADELPENRPPWIYNEKEQQNTYICEGCKARYDILGEYAGCPSCGKRNSLQVFQKHVIEVEQQLDKSDAELTEHHEREVEWEKLTRCISDFEVMARDLKGQLMLFPATPKRKKELESVSFQNILKANENLSKWFSIEMISAFSQEDKVFLNRMFNRRHVLTHNGGRIDQEYLDNTGDTTVVLNQKIGVRSKEIRRLLPLLRVAAQNLFQGFESIS